MDIAEPYPSLRPTRRCAERARGLSATSPALGATANEVVEVEGAVGLEVWGGMSVDELPADEETAGTVVVMGTPGVVSVGLSKAGGAIA